MNARHVLSLFALVLLPATALAAFPFPDTDAGRRAAAYLEAFNTGREDAVRACIEANVSKAALAQRSVEERLAIYRELRDQHRTLTPLRVLESADDHLHLVARTGHGQQLDLTFLCEPDPPHLLMGLRIEEGGPGPDDAASAAPATPLSDHDAIQAWSTALDSLTKVGEFSGAVLLAKNGNVIFQSAYGEASRESHTPNRVDTKFNLGSINKIFTKVAIAQLVAHGKIDLDATIDRYLPDYPTAANKVTVRELLDHRGGIGDVFGDAYDRADKATLRRVSDWIPLFRDQPLAFEPGTRQQYSNGGYILLGAIVEKVSGEDYYDYMRRHVYGPLGLRNTDHYAKDDHVGNLANGYTRHRDPGVVIGADGLGNNAPTRPMRGSPAGGGYSTLADLLAFTQALRAGKVADPQVLRNGFQELAPGPDGQMGLGIGGGAPGLNAAVEMKGPYTVVVLANLDPPKAERAASMVRRWLPGLSGGTRVRVGGGSHGSSSERVVAPDAESASETHDGPAVMVAQGPEAPERTIVPEGGVEVEMSRSDHLPAVSVMIDGKGPYRFALDTGGGGNASVDSSVAAALGLETIGQARAGDPSGRNVVTIDLVHLGSLAIGGARFEGLTASVRAGRLRRMGEPVDGILGFRLFQNCLLTLDYPSNRLRIDRGELPAPNGNDVIAFSSRQGIPSVRLQVDSIWVDADVDAGSSGGFTLPERFEGKLPLVSAPRVVGHARTIGNEFEIRAADLKGAVRLGGFAFPGATVSFQPVFPTANVGARVLRDFRVTFDQKNGRMRLSRAT